MTTKLKNLKITEGSLVDKGANQEAEVVLFKREEDIDQNIHSERIDWTKEGALEKVGRKISGGRMKVLKELMATFDSLTQKLGAMFTDIEGTQKGANMPIKEDVLNDLPDEVKQHIADLEKSKTENETKFSEKETELEESVTKADELATKVEELEKSGKTDEERKKEEILKGASDEVIEKVADLEKKVEAAEEATNIEKEARITKEYEVKAESLTHIPGSKEEIAKQIRVAHESSPEEGAKLEETFKALNEQVEKSGLFKEAGTEGSDAGGDADAKIEAGGLAIAKAENISKEQGIAKFMATDEGRELYSQAGGLN